MTAKDIRWIQRFNNFAKAFAQLKEAWNYQSNVHFQNSKSKG